MIFLIIFSPPYVPHSFVIPSTKRKHISTTFETSFVSKVPINSPRKLTSTSSTERNTSSKHIRYPQKHNILSSRNKKKSEVEASRIVSSCPSTERMSQEEESMHNRGETHTSLSKNNEIINKNDINKPFETVETSCNDSSPSDDVTKPCEINSTCAISLEISDENGDKGAVVWHDPGRVICTELFSKMSM